MESLKLREGPWKGLEKELMNDINYLKNNASDLNSVCLVNIPYDEKYGISKKNTYYVESSEMCLYTIYKYILVHYDVEDDINVELLSYYINIGKTIYVYIDYSHEQLEKMAFDIKKYHKCDYVSYEECHNIGICELDGEYYCQEHYDFRQSENSEHDKNSEAITDENSEHDKNSEHDILIEYIITYLTENHTQCRTCSKTIFNNILNHEYVHENCKWKETHLPFINSVIGHLKNLENISIEKRNT